MIVKLYTKDFDEKRLSALLAVEVFEDDGTTPYPVLVCYNSVEVPEAVIPPSGTHGFSIFPSRRLTAIASPDDLLVYTNEPAENGLYLAHTVHRYCLSVHEMTLVESYLKADFFDLTYALAIPPPTLETITI